MAPDAVAEIYTPGQGGWNAIGIVSQAGEEAPQASNRNPEAEWHGKEVTSADVNPANLLDQLDGEQSTHQPADYGLAAHQRDRIMEMSESESLIFNEEEQL